MAFKFEDVTVTGWILLVVLVACAAGLIAISRSKQKWTLQMMANAAICMALSFVLSYIRLFKMPQGGSITPASLLPILAFAYYHGSIPGLVTGIASAFNSVKTKIAYSGLEYRFSFFNMSNHFIIFKGEINNGFYS